MKKRTAASPPPTFESVFHAARRPAEAAQVLRDMEINGRTTRVLVEQTTAVDPSRLGDSLGHLTFDEQRQVDAALRLVLDL